MSRRPSLRRKPRAALVLAVLVSAGVGLGTVITPAHADGGCGGYSTLSCGQVAPALPFLDDFTSTTGTYGGTGFTMMQPSSQGGTYQPGLITVDPTGTGTMTIQPTPGTNYLAPPTAGANTLDNGLGIGVDAQDEALTISTTMTSIPVTKNDGEGFGLWFGPDEDNYVKLALTASTGGVMKPQLLREIAGASGSSDVKNAATISATGHTVQLTLTTNPTTGVVVGSYSLDGAAAKSIGSLTVPASFFSGSTLTTSIPHATSFTGIFATRRKNPAALSLGYDSFNVSGTDLAAPAAPQGVSATANGSEVDLAWTANSEKDLAGYEVFRSTTSPVATNLPPISGSSPIAATSYADTATSPGTTYYYAIEAVDLTGNLSTPSGQVSATTAAPTAPASFSLTNLDGQPAGNRLVLNQIGTPVDANQHTHLSGTIRVTNTGTVAATVSGIAVTSGPYTASAGTALPVTLAPGQYVDVTATMAASTTGINTGQLAIYTVGGAGEYDVALEGWWQQHSEEHEEPQVSDIISLFGYGTAIPSTMDDIGAYTAATADEVLTRNWRRADTTAPVGVQEIASFHTYPSSSTLTWYAKGSSTTLNQILITSKYDAQSFFPRRSAVTGAPASATFTPGGAFNIKVDNEFGDAYLNSQTTDRKNGCHATQCGHAVRFFILRDSTGAVVPNTYLVFEDANSVNYDFQDNVYLLSNVQPEATGTPAAPTASPGNASIGLSWPAVAGGDVAGYNVYRDTTSAVSTSSVLLTSSPVTSPSFVDSTVTNGTTYWYAVQTVYADGTTSDLSGATSATPTNPALFQLHVDFTSPSGALGSNYLRDDGQPYGPRTGSDQGGQTYGWVVPGTTTPLDLSVGGSTPGNGRVRGLESNVAADSIFYMQAPDSAQPFNGTDKYGSWMAAIPNGTYKVTLVAGDPQTSSSKETDELSVNGSLVLGPFTPSGKNGSATRQTTATITITVTGGFLTIDATGGTNTKIASLDLVQIS